MAAAPTDRAAPDLLSLTDLTDETALQTAIAELRADSPLHSLA